MLSSFGRAFRTPEVRMRILFTLMMLALFRLGSVLPVPNVDVAAINQCRDSLPETDQAGLYSLINLFSGGALLRLAVFALGIMPYITSSIILQLMTVVVPRLEALKKEGGTGQQKITEYTRYLTLVLAVLNSTAFVTLAASGGLMPTCGQIVLSTDVFPIVVMILVMTAGTGLVMWMGELITERGLGNGMSVMIFTQVAATFPTALWGVRQDQGIVPFILVLIVGLMVMAAVLAIELGQRRIPVQYAKRMVGRRMFGGSTTYIPLKVNQAGVIPVIFSSSMLYIPALIAQFNPESKFGQWVNEHFVTGDHPIYLISFFVLTIAFTYFYVSITFNPQEVSDNMKKYGGFIPGVRAGRQTVQYLGYVLSRLTAPGSLYLAVIAIIPTLAFILFNANQNFPFGGTSLLIIVGVGLDTVRRMESKLQQREYEGFLS